MLDDKLLKILVCPKCKGELSVLVAQTALDCHACKLRFKVENDIPNMLISEALSIESEGQNND